MPDCTRASPKWWRRSQEDFGISIQHAVSLNFDQFSNVVNAVGGINMSFPESVYDAESALNVQAAAWVHLNGAQRRLQAAVAGPAPPVPGGLHHRRCRVTGPRKRRATWLGSSVITSSSAWLATAVVAARRSRRPPDGSGT